MTSVRAVTYGVSAGYEAVTPSAEEQLAALQEALGTAEGPTAEAVLPDGCELGSANLGRTYMHAALQEVFSAQRAKVRTFDQPGRLLCAQPPLEAQWCMTRTHGQQFEFCG